MAEKTKLLISYSSWGVYMLFVCELVREIQLQFNLATFGQHWPNNSTTFYAIHVACNVVMNIFHKRLLFY